MKGRYEEASSGVRGDRVWRCVECSVLVANRYDHDATAHDGLRADEVEKIDASLAECCDGHAKFGICYNDPEDER